MLALLLNAISSPFVLRLVVDILRQGSFFSYIVVEIVWLCKFVSLIESYMLTMISYPLDSLVVKRILCRLDRWSTYRYIPGRVKLRFWVFRSVSLFFTRLLFDSYAILVDASATQGCHEIKGIMAFSFLAWILRNTLRFERSRMPLTV